MTGVPGGDVTLHAAITDTLAEHEWITYSPRQKSRCTCGWRWKLGSPHAAHQAERVLAVLADRLPHTPPEQLADLIGGTVEWGVRHSQGTRSETSQASARDWAADKAARIHRPDVPKPYVVGRVAAGPWVPDSPPAAPEPDHAAPQRSAAHRDADGEVRRTAAPEPRQDT